MDIVQQRTVKNSIHCRGVGLHSGVKASLTLLPAPPDTGIVFRRTDAAGAGVVPESSGVARSCSSSACISAKGWPDGGLKHTPARPVGSSPEVTCRVMAASRTSRQIGPRVSVSGGTRGVS